ncbi:hypothetical protein K458DRAFT_153148 [Lentithecium fluviatile CBS 122367]|uniref:Uncharacterized protein n=1 Tax=Lentithecium fluviatile CBS 122367 TaxID=1168545 RepID=A0A6G1JE19_9PLEO|nr:hypothetical protein K458DRAFT_153148 [Lentithecium fluviatile CBS 122367]
MAAGGGIYKFFQPVRCLLVLRGRPGSELRWCLHYISPAKTRSSCQHVGRRLQSDAHSDNSAPWHGLCELKNRRTGIRSPVGHGSTANCHRRRHTRALVSRRRFGRCSARRRCRQASTQQSMSSTSKREGVRVFCTAGYRRGWSGSDWSAAPTTPLWRRLPTSINVWMIQCDCKGDLQELMRQVAAAEKGLYVGVGRLVDTGRICLSGQITCKSSQHAKPL